MTTPNALHTPLEELIFFSMLQEHGAGSSSFAKVSALLQDDEYIKNDPQYDAERLSPANLQQLYLRLLKEEVRSVVKDATASETEGDTNKRKRKQSTPPLQSLEDASQHSHLLPQLVDRLYAQYQDQAVNEIQEEEARYDQLRKEIEEIERGEWDARLEDAAKQQAQNGTAEPMTGVEQTAAQVAKSRLQTPANDSARASPIPRPRSALQDKGKAGEVTVPNLSIHPDEAQAQARVPSLPPSAMTQPSTSQVPPSPAGVAGPGPSPDQTPFLQPERPAGSPAVGASSSIRASASPHRQSGYLTDIRARSPATTASLQQIPPQAPPPGAYGQQPHYYAQQQQYPGYPPYPPQQHIQPFQSPNQPLPLPQYQMYQHPGRPNQPLYQAQTPPVGAFQGPQPGYVGYPPGHPASQAHFYQTPVTTPISAASRRAGITPINTSVSSTRWKASPAKPGKDGTRSPTAPPLSPFLLSSPELSPMDDSKSPIPFHRREGHTRDSTGSTRGRGRGGRWQGHVPRRGRGSRGDSLRTPQGASTPDQSARSPGKESTPDISHPQTRKLKAEPSTPAAATTDETSAISTPTSTAARPTRRRDTVRQSLDLGRSALKRKRADTLDNSGGTPDTTTMQLPQQPTRPGFVLASRNFTRVANPLMHEINSHKLASMFAKPITEKDAPGYHDIIHQPQDLKSIRAAISAGSRAVAAFEKEGIGATGEDTGSPAATPTTSGAAKGSTVWVEKTPDVLPPKGIVNGTQLEKEICRMFANAVMFNLDPQRGFGRALRKQADSNAGSEDESEDDAEKGYEFDDGGAFVRDAREMFEGVEKTVQTWRSVESGLTGEGTRQKGEDEGDESMAEG